MFQLGGAKPPTSISQEGLVKTMIFSYCHVASSDAMLVKQQRGKFQVTGLQEGWTKKTHTFTRIFFW